MSNIIKITDITKPCLDPYFRLTENQLRNRSHLEKGIFIAESKKVIELALNCGLTPLSLLLTESQLNGNSKDLAEKLTEIPIYTAKDELLENITGYPMTRGALAVFKRPLLPSVEEVCKNAKRIAVLESITDSTNVGAIIRSAAALGIDAVLVTTTCCDPLLRRSVRVSMGTVFQIPWTYIESHKNMPTDTKKLRELGFKTVAMALTDKSVGIDDRTLKSEEKLAIILGTEGTGLSSNTIESCDYTVKIPMYHNVDSLNVAAASAVAFWELKAK